MNGVRDTARYASTRRIVDSAGATAACASVKTQLINNLKAALPGYVSSRLHPTIAYVWFTNPDGTYSIRIEVSAKYDHPLMVPLVGLIVDGTDGFTDNALTIGASEQMRIENPALITMGGPVTCP